MAERSATASADPKANNNFAERAPSYIARVEAELERWATGESVTDSELPNAMRYALLNGGKRIRPLLAYATGELLAIPTEKIDPIAAAIEMIHTYSLVHDDLPAMDDDDLRRGRPTVHIAYDEATAILVGDALHALAFQVLTDHAALKPLPEVSVRLVRHLAIAVGADGMVGGQDRDIAYSGSDVTREQLEDMFARKTGRLIGAAILMPLECAHDPATSVSTALRELATVAGLCFQIRDDILDVTASTEQLGKPSGSDERNDRTSYPARFGLEAACARADELLSAAQACLASLGPRAEGLRWTTDLIAKRNQ